MQTVRSMISNLLIYNAPMRSYTTRRLGAVLLLVNTTFLNLKNTVLLI
jgi:hypothetical protein